MKFFPLFILNLTPDSFSDGGQLFAGPRLARKVDELMAQGADGFDLGAESTAPFNHPIGEGQEKRRLERLLFPVLPLLKKASILSFDTYRPAVMRWLLQSCADDLAGVQLWWNDVSGQWDQAVLSLLEDYPQLHYVCCHNLVRRREQSSFHNDFVQAGHGLTAAVENHFCQIRVKQEALAQRLIFDPTFGFAKDEKQNERLAAQLPALVRAVGHERWLLGISRKRFLRPGQALNARTQRQADRAQNGWLRQWHQHLPPGRYAIRLHDFSQWEAFVESFHTRRAERAPGSWARPSCDVLSPSALGPKSHSALGPKSQE